MDIQNFDRMPLDEKTSFLWDRGVCLNQRLVDGQEIICIFSLENFYVEAIYSRSNNRVNSIHTLVYQGQWSIYVECIIQELLLQS